MFQFQTPIIFRTILCANAQTCTTLLTTFLQATLVRYCSHTTIRYSAHNLFCKQYTYSVDLYNTQPQLHTKLIELLLTAARFVIPFYIRTPSVFRMFKKYKVHVLVSSRILQRQLMHVHSHTSVCRILVDVGFDVRVCLCRVYCVHIVSCCFLSLLYS